MKQLAQTMIQSFGAAAAGKVIELIRMQTRAGNRDAALKWHRVMSLIEEASRKSEVSGALLQTGDQPVKSQQ